MGLSESSWRDILLALIATLPAAIIALRTSAKVTEVHRSVNGRLTQLLDLSTKAATAEGKLAGRATLLAENSAVAAEVVKIAAVTAAATAAAQNAKASINALP